MATRATVLQLTGAACCDRPTVHSCSRYAAHTRIGQSSRMTDRKARAVDACCRLVAAVRGGRLGQPLPTRSGSSSVGKCCLTADLGSGRARGHPAAAHAMAVGAAHRLPCAARNRAGAQNSLRSPSVRCTRPAAPSQFTKCAARTGPIAALLSAIEIAAAGYPLPLCVAWCSFAARERRLTPAAGACCSEVLGGALGRRARAGDMSGSTYPVPASRANIHKAASHDRPLYADHGHAA